MRSEFDGCTARSSITILSPAFLACRRSPARKARRALLEERRHAFLRVRRGGAQSEEGRLEPEALRQRHLEPAMDRLDHVSAGAGAAGAGGAAPLPAHA